ncbi:hypothetical protein [Azospirillum halopraeferens]|uniref:hypothetical protein n=1 Tax=Azospirillum halopraeferens TaxID=34010 RepID=UPI0012EBC2FD|nr:hypothetical protein [Azospirillum halopraeferens]
MSDWFERIARLAALGERVNSLSESVKTLSVRVENHNERITRIETLMSAHHSDGTMLRIIQTGNI